MIWILLILQVAWRYMSRSLGLAGRGMHILSRGGSGRVVTCCGGAVDQSHLSDWVIKRKAGKIVLSCSEPQASVAGRAARQSWSTLCCRGPPV